MKKSTKTRESKIITMKKPSLTSTRRRNIEKKQEVLNAIIEMRVKRQMSKHAIFQLIMETFKLKDKMVYIYYNEAAKKIAEIYNEMNQNDIETNFQRMEELYMKAYTTGDLKTANSILKEINTLKGYYLDKLDANKFVIVVKTSE